MTVNAIIYTIFLSLIAGAATVIGAWFGHKLAKSKTSLVFGMSFAGTLMLLISFFELIPSAVIQLDFSKGVVSAAAGLIVVMVLNYAIPHIHTIRDIKGCQNRNLTKLSYLIAVGLILHDFPEGFAIANSYHYSSAIGILVAAGLFLHNLPEGYVLSACTNRHAPKNHFYELAFLSVISTTLGTIAGLSLLNFYSALGPLLTAAAAGAMVYISVHELLPMSFKLKHLLQFLLGILAAIIAYFLLSYLIT